MTDPSVPSPVDPAEADPALREAVRQDWSDQIERVAYYLYRDERGWVEGGVPWQELSEHARQIYVDRAGSVGRMLNFPYHTDLVEQWADRLCPCDHNPDTTSGPDRECPIHGDTPYALDRLHTALAEYDRRGVPSPAGPAEAERLAEAERRFRALADADRPGSDSRLLLAEYDRRGAALDAARAEVERLRHDHRLVVGEMEQACSNVDRLHREAIARDAELERLRAQHAASRPVVDAAIAYSESTAEPTDTPHEDALLDAVAAYQRETLSTPERCCDFHGGWCPDDALIFGACCDHCPDTDTEEDADA